MVINVNKNKAGLDTEWMALILEAKELGIKKGDIQNFLYKHQTVQVEVCDYLQRKSKEIMRSRNPLN